MNKHSNSVKNGQIMPINNPIPLIPDTICMQNLKTIREQILELSIGNGADVRMYGRTYGRTPEGI